MLNAIRIWAKKSGLTGVFLCALSSWTGCQSVSQPGAFVPRRGDEIVLAGQFLHTGTPVVLWMDPGGYDAYRVERRFSPYDESSWETSKVVVKDLTSPNRFGLRTNVLNAAEIERVRGGGWELALLQEKVDQFVLHFDVAGTSRQCFKVLHDIRGLSVHFMLDLDGTIYQTLDLKERAWHATSSNSRSIGIEIANVGAYPPADDGPLRQWYQPDESGKARVVLPDGLGDGGIRAKGFVARPSRPLPIKGVIQDKELMQYDFTPEQYGALIKLTAALCRAFPKLKCDFPRDAEGRLIPRKLDDEALAHYQGLLGHYHIQLNKVDPGPALDWERVVDGARGLLRQAARPEPDKPATRMMRRP